MSFTPYDRPVRAAFVGLGRIYDLNMRAYLDNPDVEVVALVDPSEERRSATPTGLARRPTFASAAELAASGLEVDAVEGLLPIPAPRRRGRRAPRLRLARQSAEADVQRPRRTRSGCSTPRGANGRLLRVMENYLFYEPLRKLKETVESGELGEVSGYHMKMVASGRRLGRPRQLRVAVPADARGRGILVFDDGWHKLATALWLFGPIKEVRAWVGRTEVGTRLRHRRPPPSCGNTTTGSAACGTSPSRSTCTCAPTTTRTTNAGRSPAATGTRG